MTVRYFAVAGLAGGAAASLFLFSLYNPAYPQAVASRGVRHFGSSASLVVFPLAAAALSAFWARILESRFGPKRVGIAFGCAVATLAFVSLIVLLAVLHTMAPDGTPAEARYGRLELFLGLVAAYLAFGGALVGWALVILGGVTGWLAGRRVRRPDDAPKLDEAFRRWLGARWPPRPSAPPKATPVGPASLETRRPFSESPLQRLGLSLLELPVALGVAYAVFVGVVILGCRIHPCYDLQALGPMMVALPCAAIAGIAYWIVALKIGKRIRGRLIWDGAALMVAAAPFVVSQVATHVRESEQRVQARVYEQMDARMRTLWIEAMKQDAHGPPGEVPPMLAVVDEGAAAVVTNTSAASRSVSLGRVVPDPAAPGGWRGCAMITDDKWASYFHWLAPGESMRFVLDPTCADAFAGALIEYRVGEGPHQQGWWSDSAFATPDGRKPRQAR